MSMKRNRASDVDVVGSPSRPNIQTQGFDNTPWGSTCTLSSILYFRSAARISRASCLWRRVLEPG